ncbi:hypothetical protein CDD80_6854 [Ophiocordyceps camponoti-rufipedis]|uniref:Bifunctional cytochrome P450/NADPH--P450 reductase n=1 Tax=Ophiocordyceps camponoti-rufipedis TaxID=2004952 RepID=A0A2C5ZBP3_9HYPO|nr:hypothetical protein CDD80_6854 [Ophiocordyceps camponoti-rufipedis]
MPKDIPAPGGLPIVGNALQIDSEQPQESLARFSEIYGKQRLKSQFQRLRLTHRIGPIFKLRVPEPRIFFANYALVQDLFDEKRFQKNVGAGLKQVRNATRDGLFTAFPEEPSWAIAHRILMPAFGPLAIRAMFAEMKDISAQMILKLARFGPDHLISVSDEFTNLTLDSIALCAMGTRFNSFYHDEPHRFVSAMTGVLSESAARSKRPSLIGKLHKESNRKYKEDIETLESISKEMLQNRRQHPTDDQDLLNAMINGKDPKTGQKLRDETIIANMITFLIAGHETTSGLLSFLFYELLQSPEALKEATKEVDNVIGTAPVTVEHMSKLPYIEACLRETLRLHPTAPAFSLEAKGDQLINGEYLIKDKQACVVLLMRLHRDPEVFGSDAEEFRPSRMYGENFTKLPPNCWKPFGNGSRGCIGRPFAWQEAILAVAMLLQTFHFSKGSASYQLKIKSTLTIKPDNFYMRARLRDPKRLESLTQLGPETKSGAEDRESKNKAGATNKEGLTPLWVLYGSNTGTCEALAQSLACSAPDHGFKAEVKDLDSAPSALSAEIPAVIITASYEGQPPDNAGHFVEGLKTASKDESKGVNFAVFGVGNKEWKETYQKIPIVIDEALVKAGANQLAPRASVDVAQGNIFDALYDWQDKSLWPALSKLYGKKDEADNDGELGALNLEIGTQTRSKLLRQDVVTAEVSESRLLTRQGAAARKRHIVVNLPSGLSYRAGDYLAVLPVNPSENVRRVMKRFQLPWDATITIDEKRPTSLPTGKAINVSSTLSTMVELSQPVSNRVAIGLAKTIPEEKLVKELEARAAEEDFQADNVTLLDLLEDYPTANFSFGQFLAAVPPMRIRQYSISSTPLSSPYHCSLTYSVVDAPARGSRHGHRFLGVASSYMERLEVGERIQISIRPSRNGFHLPTDDSKPIIMACAGTGLAPFRAFVAERALKKSGGREVGPALLFYGCSRPEDDDLYRDELDKWEAEGAVRVRRAYSKQPDASEGCKYVQDRLWLDREHVRELYAKGAQLYCCGAGAVGSAVEDTMVRIKADVAGCDTETAYKWVQERKGDRYYSDIFS